MAIYPPQIIRKIDSGRNIGPTADPSASATSASFVCGCYVELSIRIDQVDRLDSIRFLSNGCGYMIAAAEALCDRMRGKRLPELHGLNENELMSIVTAQVGELPGPRLHCTRVVFDALRRTLAQYRERRMEEFVGEKALICTCFGVSEETIVNAIERLKLSDVEEVADLCRAGSGCGSCRMLIQELIDTADDSG